MKLIISDGQRATDEYCGINHSIAECSEKTQSNARDVDSWQLITCKRLSPISQKP